MQITPALILACLAAAKTVSALPLDNTDSFAERSVNDIDARGFDAELFDMERREDSQDLNTREFYESLISRGLEELDAREVQEELESRGLFGLATKAAKIGGKAIGLGNIFDSQRRDLPHGHQRHQSKRHNKGQRKRHNKGQRKRHNKGQRELSPMDEAGVENADSDVNDPNVGHVPEKRHNKGQRKRHNKGQRKRHNKGQREQYPVDEADDAPAPVNDASGVHDPTVGEAAP